MSPFPEKFNFFSRLHVLVHFGALYPLPNSPPFFPTPLHYPRFKAGLYVMALSFCMWINMLIMQIMQSKSFVGLSLTRICRPLAHWRTVQECLRPLSWKGRSAVRPHGPRVSKIFPLSWITSPHEIWGHSRGAHRRAVHLFEVCHALSRPAFIFRLKFVYSDKVFRGELQRWRCPDGVYTARRPREDTLNYDNVQHNRNMNGT